jgi:UDP-N-acetylglucosamine 4,6-dehydratase/5-epimerase
MNLSKEFDGATVLITGGTGTFGSRFAKVILNEFDVERVIIFSRDELKQHQMQLDPFFSNDSRMRWFLGDIRDKERLALALRVGVDYIVHAAALKQVPALEYNPFEAVKTNIIGSQNVIETAMGANVKKVIALSTDKAAAPINLYGATKLAADKLFIAANSYTGTGGTKFAVVRYGNVMGSRGSVIPYLIEKRESGTLPITNPEMTRFSITLDAGIRFVLEAFSRIRSGEIFVPKLPSYRLRDVASAVGPECKIQITGIRPGEKMHEEMITKSDARNTLDLDDCYIMVPDKSLVWGTIQDYRLITGGKSVPDEFSYSSENNPDFLSVMEIRELISTKFNSGSVFEDWL